MNSTNSANQEKASRKQLLDKVIQHVLENQSAETVAQERRSVQRAVLNQQLSIQLEDGSELSVFCKDLSESGIRFVANRSLLGHKLIIHIQANDEASGRLSLTTRIIWSTAVADDVYENGGTILEIATEPES